MSEDFEPYHVPQQSRRDKLRILDTQNHLEQSLQNSSSFGASFYDQSSLISSYLQNYIALEHKSTNHFEAKANFNKGSVSLTCYDALGESSSRILMSSTSSNASLVDLQTCATHLNPNVQIQELHKNMNTQYIFMSEGIGMDPEDTRISRWKYNLDHNSFHDSGDKGLSLSLSSPQNHFLRSGGGDLRWNNDEVGPVSLGYFLNYGSVLTGSRFLKPAQQLLEEHCYVGRYEVDDDDSGLNENAIIDDPRSCIDGSDYSSRRKSRLISLLQEVFRRYKQYYQQVQEIVASFESVTGLSDAAPFKNLALNSLTKHFRSLKNLITHQLEFPTKSKDNDGVPSVGNLKRSLDFQIPFQVGNQPVWKPQRGLPDHAVRVLKTWLYEHFLHPYPTDSDKVMLAKQTGLSRSQVSNWFINARVRLWKPMVEEIHMLETQQPKETSQREECIVNLKSGSSRYTNGSNSSAEFVDFRSKRSRSNKGELHVRNDQREVQLSYDNFSRHPRHITFGSNTAGGSNGVSLTLGLHQNNSAGLSNRFPENAARRFGLNEDSQDYIIGEFEAQNSQFGRNILGGQLVHDFVD